MIRRNIMGIISSVYIDRDATAPIIFTPDSRVSPTRSGRSVDVTLDGRFHTRVNTLLEESARMREYITGREPFCGGSSYDTAESVYVCTPDIQYVAPTYGLRTTPPYMDK